jgi:hypothetical protein
VDFAGTIRDSACLAAAANSTAIGVSNATVGTTTATLRNVTAVDTGAGGNGLEYAIASGTETVNAMAVIAKGDTVDVLASAAATGHVAIELDHSDFATTEATTAPGGSASVTLSSANENVSAEPQLAFDGFHELKGSPTVDAGAVDGSSGTADIDGQDRSIGAPDIGADELARSTQTTLACVPASLTLGAMPSTTACTVTVSDTSGEFEAPTSAVTFSSNAAGIFDASGECLALPQGEGISKCTIDYSPAVAGSHELTATYGGDATHEASKGSFSLKVEAAPPSGGGGGGSTGGGAKGEGGKGGNGNGGGAAPNTSIGKEPPKRTRKRRARFTFSATQANARFECKLDRRPFRSCASPFRIKVRPGRHSFQVRAVSAAGKADPTPAAYRWRVLRG